MAILFWIAGYMFSVGVYANKTRKRSVWHVIKVDLALFLLWPLGLGVITANLIEIVQKEGE